MEVHVVAAHVGHHCQIELAAGQPVLGQPVGGRLQHGVAAARLHHLGQQRLHLRRLRRGEAAAVRQRAPGRPVLGGAHQASALPRRLQEMGDEMAEAGLAIGAGDADDGELSGGPLEEGGCGLRQRPAGVGHGQARQRQAGPLGAAVRLHQDSRRAGLHRLAQVVVPVVAVPRHRHEQRPRLHPSRVILDGVELCLAGADDLRRGEISR